MTTAANTSMAETTTRQYDMPTGLVSSTTDPNNVTTTIQYDGAGRPTQTLVGGRQTSFQYFDIARYAVRQSDLNTTEDGALTEVYRYDPLGRLWMTQQTDIASDSVASTSSLTWGIQTLHFHWVDGSGSFVADTNPYRSGDSLSWTRTHTDRMGRVDQVAHYSGCLLNPTTTTTCPTTTGTAQTAYNYNTAASTDEFFKQKNVTTNAQGGIVSVQEDPNGLNYLTQYAYDGRDDLTGVTQGVQSRTFSYDALKRLTSANNPESGMISYSSYDMLGNLLTKSDPNSVTTTYRYDALSRILSKSYTANTKGVATPPVAYTYDGAGTACPRTSYPIGRLSSVTATGSAATFQSTYDCYDVFGQVTQSTQTTVGQPFVFTGASGAQGYTYNLAGGLKQIVYPSGRTIATTYDAAGRVLGVQGASMPMPYASGLQYAAHGGVKQATLGNTLTEQTCYNDRLQPTAIRLGTGASGNCAAVSTDPFYLGYGYNGTTNNGNLASQTITAPETAGGLLTMAQGYTYDGVNRLLTAAETVTGFPTGTTPGTWSLNFGYDQYGNQWTTTLLPPTPGTPSGLTQFAAASNKLVLLPDKVTAMPGDAYDAGGNLQDHQLLGQMMYDGENRLVTFTSTVGTSTTYDYDGQGRRVRKTLSGAVTLYVYDAGGQLTAEYAASNPNAGTQYYTADNLGSTRVITNASGQVTARMDYEPFGGVLGGAVEGNRNLVTGYSGDPDLSFEFTGKERDAESGLDYFGARYFSGAQGRWTSPDRPFADQDITNPQSWNLYTYVRNNPLANIDRSGSQTQGVGLAAWLAEHEPQIIATANAIKTAKGFADIATAIKEAVWGSTTPSGKIEDALASDNVGVAMEGIVAEYVDLKFHGDIVGVNVPVPDPANPRDLLTDLDIQLKFAVVEIKTGTKRLGKNLDVKKQFGPVIVYAPQATPGQQRDLARNGGIWVGNIFDLLEKLTEVKENVQSTIKFPKNPDDQDQ